MALTALLTLLQWQSLFPSLRDYMALTGFPVSARQIFAAKFGALVLIFVAFVLSLTGPLAGNFSAWSSAGTGRKTLPGMCPHGCHFRRPRRRHVPSSFLPSWPCRVCCSTSCPAAGFCASRSSCRPPCSSPPSARFRYAAASPRPPLWWPPVWFVSSGKPSLRDGLRRGPPCSPSILPADPRGAVSAQLSPLPASCCSKPRRARAGGTGPGWGSRLLELWIRNPREQAAFAFTWKTLCAQPHPPPDPARLRRLGPRLGDQSRARRPARRPARRRASTASWWSPRRSASPC